MKIVDTNSLSSFWEVWIHSRNCTCNPYVATTSEQLDTVIFIGQELTAINTVVLYGTKYHSKPETIKFTFMGGLLLESW